MKPETRSVKVPSVLYRQGETAVQEDGTIRMSISSDEPYKRFDWWNGEEYWEVLDHTGGGADLTRIVAGTALLYNHDRDIQLGKIQSPEMTAGKCYVKATLSAADDVKDFRTRITEGILKDCSVGYEIEDQGEEIGEREGLPIYRFAWTPFEASMVTIPADITVGVGRERDLEKPKGEPREIRIREKDSQKKVDVTQDESHKREKPHSTKAKSMTPEEQKVADEKERKQRERDEADATRERDDKIQEGVKAARERETEIRDIAKRATVPEDKKGEFERSMQNAIDKAVKDEKAVSDFQTYVFKNFWGKAEVLDTPSGQGGGDINGKGKKGRSLGEQFIESESFQNFAKSRGKRSASIEVEYPILGIRGKVAMAQSGIQERAGFTSSDLAPVNVQIQTGMIGLGVQRLTIMDVFAPGTTNAAAIIYPQETTFGTVDGVAVAAGAMPRAKSVGERGVKPLWEPDLTTVTANVKKIAITTKVPDEFMADFPAAQSFINERLPFMVDTETEFQMLYGDGLGNNLKGVTTFAGVQTRAILTTSDTTIAASLMKGLTDIRVNAFFEPDFYAFHPYDWETAKLLVDTTGRFLAGGPHYIPYTNSVFMELNTFWGKPVVVSTAVTYGKPLAGCGKLGAQYFIREGMRLESTNSNEDDFRRNLIMLRAEHRLALAVYRPVAFLEFTGMPART